MNFLINKFSYPPSNSNAGEDHGRSSDCGALLTDRYATVRTCAEIATVQSLTTVLLYPFNLTQKYSLVGLEPLQSSNTIIKNGKIIMSMPNCLQNTKTWFNVMGPRFLTRGLLLDCGIISFRSIGEYLINKTLVELEDKERIPKRKKSVEIPAEKSLKSLAIYLKDLSLNFILNNIHWVAPLFITYPLITTLNCYVVANVTKDPLYNTLPKAFCSIFQSEGLRGFYYGFKAFFCFEYLHKLLLNYAVEFYDLLSDKSVPSPSPAATDASADTDNKDEGDNQPRHHGAAHLRHQPLKHFAVEQLVQIGTASLYSASFLLSINHKSSVISADALVGSCHSLMPALNSLFDPKYSYRNALFFRQVQMELPETMELEKGK